MRKALGSLGRQRSDSQGPTTGLGSVGTEPAALQQGWSPCPLAPTKEETAETPGWIRLCGGSLTGSTVGWRLWCLVQPLEAMSFLSLEASKQQLTLQRLGCCEAVSSWKEEGVGWELCGSGL